MVEKLGEVEISDNEDAQLLLEKLVCILFRLNESLRADKLLLDVVLLFPRLVELAYYRMVLSLVPLVSFAFCTQLLKEDRINTAFSLLEIIFSEYSSAD